MKTAENLMELADIFAGAYRVYGPEDSPVVDARTTLLTALREALSEQPAAFWTYFRVDKDGSTSGPYRTESKSVAYGDDCIDQELTRQPAQQEPIGSVAKDGFTILYCIDQPLPFETDLYTPPPQRQPLTEMDIMTIAHACRNNDQIGYVLEIARAIEAAHGITKGGAQ